MKILRSLLGGFYDVPAIKFVAELIFVIIPIAVIIRTFGFGFYIVPTPSMETTLLVGERFFADKLSYWFKKPKRGEIVAFNQPGFEYSKNPILKLWQKYLSWNVQNWTKRVIGMPGDSVKGVIENDKTAIYLKKAGEDEYKKLDESSYVNNNPIILVWKYPHYYGPSGYKEGADDKTFKSYDPNLPFDQQIFYNINPVSIALDARTHEPIVRWPGTPSDRGVDVFEITLKDNEYWLMGDNRLGSYDSREWGVMTEDQIHGRIIFRLWSMDTDESWILLDLIKNPIGFWKKIRWSRVFQWVK